MMPPQFFKDAHSVLNNKFVPRAFSLNLNNTKDSLPNGEKQTQSSDGIDDSLVSPQAISTAPSTGSSSRFFGAYHGGKDSKATKELLCDSLLEDSSMDNIENFVKAAISESGPGSFESSVKRPVSNRTATDSSDDLLITDIREISNDHSNKEEAISTRVSKEHSNKSSIKEVVAAESSVDLVMEALVKSQRLCSQLKEKLAQANSKISFQEDELSLYKNNTDSLKVSVKSLKEHLITLESKSTELKDAKKKENNSFAVMKSELKGIYADIESFKSEAAHSKKVLEQLNQIKISNSYEIERSMYLMIGS